MSFADDPEFNPYAAPKSDVEFLDEDDHCYLVRDNAGFWLRVAASIIDQVVVTVLGMMVRVPFAIFHKIILVDSPQGRARIGDPLVVVLGFLQLIALVLLSMIYYAGMESSRYQGTLGKMAVGIQVTDLDGRRVSGSRAVGRFFAKVLSNLTCGIGYLMAAFTEQKQALHDLVAGTLVIRR